MYGAYGIFRVLNYRQKLTLRPPRRHGFFQVHGLLTRALTHALGSATWLRALACALALAFHFGKTQEVLIFMTFGPGGHDHGPQNQLF